MSETEGEMSETEGEIMKHFSHEHDLELRVVRPEIVTDVICQICNRSFAQDGPRCYACWRCSHFIHIKCGELPQHINHSLHPLHPLTLANRPFNNTSISSSCCYYCEKPFELNEGYTYACEQCSDFHMHRECATIPLPTLITSSSADGDQPADQKIVQYACHQNPMILVEHDHDGGRKGESAQCFACHEIWSAPAYSCTSNECGNFLHKSCADLKLKIYHPFHSRHPLRLQVSKPQSCRSCRKKKYALHFSCHEDGCNFSLCPKCSFLNTTVKCQSHDHLLSLVRNASSEIQCDACQKSYKNSVDIVPDEINHTRSYLFRCMECDFNLHFLCGPLPSSIKYDYHIHHLILLDHLVAKHDSDEYYYCDICEEEMDPLFRCYYCENCKYAAHIHCLLFEIMEVINYQERRDVELIALGEHRWYKGHHTEGNTEEEFTLNDILDKLHPAEKAMLIDPVGSLDPEEKALRRKAYHAWRQFNSRFEVEGSIEDIDRIQRFLYFDDKKGSANSFWVELKKFAPEEGLKIENKYLRQKVENVDGYKVPKTLAPILRAFISENDLHMKASLTPEMKSITATLLCIVIDRMYRTKFEDVTWNDIKYWFFYLEIIIRITGANLGNSSNMEQFMALLDAFLGLEAIRRKKNTIKKLHSRITELGADLERCKGLLEKIKGYDESQASEYIKEGLKKASEFKQENFGDLYFGGKQNITRL